MKKQSFAKGFTIIEVLISAAILLIAMLAITQYLSKAQIASSKLSRNVVARKILDEQISKILAIASTFPLIKNSSGTVLTYVGCFDKDGGPLDTKNSSEGFEAVALTTWGSLSNNCLYTDPNDKLNAKFEFQIQPISSSTHTKIQTMKVMFFSIVSGKVDFNVEINNPPLTFSSSM